jgi:hypothetical protein
MEEAKLRAPQVPRFFPVLQCSNTPVLSLLQNLDVYHPSLKDLQSIRHKRMI